MVAPNDRKPSQKLGERKSNPGIRVPGSVTITGAQRDALYQVLITQLSVFDDLRLAYERRDVDIALSNSLGRMVADAIRLIMDGGIGWGDISAADSVELTLSEPELRSILGGVRCASVKLLEALRPEFEEKLAKLQGIELARDACTHALTQLSERGR